MRTVDDAGTVDLAPKEVREYSAARYLMRHLVEDIKDQWVFDLVLPYMPLNSGYGF